MTDLTDEKRRLGYSLFFPSVFLAFIWLVKLSEVALDTSFVHYGLLPLNLKGLIGIFTAPLIHADFYHLINNSLPVFILSISLFYFYPSVAFRVFFLAYIISGIWVWFAGRDAYHIGASGLIYALASFLFFSGIIRNYIKLMAISLLVVFLYGSLVWGIFPIIKEISWESHLSGGLAGLILAVFYRKYGPQRKKHEWELEEEDTENYDDTLMGDDHIEQDS